MVVPSGMLSNTMAASPSDRYATSALRRSSSLNDQAAAGGFFPVTARITIMSAVVFPPPRFPAVTKNAGRSGSSTRSRMVSASPISTHLPVKLVATSHSQSFTR